MKIWNVRAHMLTPHSTDCEAGSHILLHCGSCNGDIKAGLYSSHNCSTTLDSVVPAMLSQPRVASTASGHAGFTSVSSPTGTPAREAQLHC